MTADSKSRKEAFLDLNNRDLLKAQIHEICLFYKKKYKVELIKGKYVKNAIIKTVRYYRQYLKEFDCKVTSLDFYKTYAWLGYFMAEELRSKDMQYKMMNVVVWRLIKQLEGDNKNVKKCDDFFTKLLSLLRNELSQQGEFGIGKNGLYMIMKIASLIDCN